VHPQAFLPRIVASVLAVPSINGINDGYRVNDGYRMCYEINIVIH